MLNALFARLLIALALVCGASTAAASQTYHVSIDTAALAGQDGYLDFLMLGLKNASPVQAQLSGFSGAYTAQGFTTGAASGSVASTVAIGNGEAWNEVGQWVHYGGIFSFDLRFDASGASGAGTVLSIALLDSTFNYLGTNADLITFSLLAGAVDAVDINSSFATVSVVPEPGTWLLFLSGLLLLWRLAHGARPAQATAYGTHQHAVALPRIMWRQAAYVQTICKGMK